MDVVRRSIVDLGGRIIISSTPGVGSRFSLTLPLTLAVLDGMVVAVGDQTFVLPLSHIIESLRPRAEDIRPFGVDRSLLHVRESYVPLVKIGELLGVTRRKATPRKALSSWSRAKARAGLALAVDAILGQRQVVIKGFETNYHHIEGIAAATILGDGRVALILDVDGLVTRCRTQFTRPTSANFRHRNRTMNEPKDKSHEGRRQFITFVSSDQEFGADIMTIREIRGWTETTPLPHAPDFVRGVINLRGVVLPVVDLKARSAAGHDGTCQACHHGREVRRTHHRPAGRCGFRHHHRHRCRYPADAGIGARFAERTLSKASPFSNSAWSPSSAWNG